MQVSSTVLCFCLLHSSVWSRIHRAMLRAVSSGTSTCMEPLPACLSILIQTCSFAVFDGRFLFHRVPSPAGWLRRWLRGCHPPQA